ncbi:MBL fold metallo-hydrolase [Cephaloticoccus primus]|uniref:MBL fold metallo-hydrolase n=1 Tax=Cephaloticoccus primus TaxID=1548207 RepID=A0A139SN94_9BACT|nr:MBL fold metallo-hydrolase [Cephaloticoccus primus]KXU35944.1 MBL fold metallo-hydrolase [Cephaloticoccus primus]
MPRIPIEDNFDDVINKTQRGLKISDEDLAARAEITAEQLAAVKSGKPLYGVIRRVARHLNLSPDALEVLAKKAWYPEQPNLPRGFAMFNTPYEDMFVNAYMVWDPRTRQAAAFDTGSTCEGMLDVIRDERLDLRYILLTHTHGDHIADLARLAELNPRAEIWASEREPVDHPRAQTFKENAHFHLGELAIKTLLTWGHTPGQTSFYVTGLSWPLVIVGDSIFSCSMGGSPNFFGNQLHNNKEKLMTLPKDTVIAPGHGPLTTVGQEKKYNPFFAR